MRRTGKLIDALCEIGDVPLFVLRDGLFYLAEVTVQTVEMADKDTGEILATVAILEVGDNGTEQNLWPVGWAETENVGL